MSNNGSLPDVATSVNLAQSPPWPSAMPAMPASTPATALDAALGLIAAGGAALPVDLEAGKVPARKAWQTLGKGSTTDPKVAGRWWGPHGRYRGPRYGVGLALMPSRLVVVEGDGPDANAGLSDVVMAAGGAPPTFAVQSKGGPKFIFTRPAAAELEERNSNHPNRPELGGADLILGYVLAWAPGRTWHGTPADVAPCPAWIADAAVAIVGPRHDDPPPPRASMPPLEPGARGPALVRGLVDYWVRRIAAMAPGSGRGPALYSGRRAVGEVEHMAPELASWADSEFLAAAHACGLVRDDGRRRVMMHIRNGARDGRAHPRGVPDRPGWTPTPAGPAAVLEAAVGSEADAVRDAARARLRTLRADVDALRDEDGRPLHAMTRASIRLVAGWILETVAQTGRPSVVEGLASVGLAVDRGAPAVSKAARWLPALGIDVDFGDSAAGRATCWHFRASRNATDTACLPLPAGRGVGVTPKRYDVTENPGVPMEAVLTEAATGLCRGLRRAPKRAPTPAGDEPAAPVRRMGAYAGDMVAALRAAGELDVAAAAAAVGCSESTARRTLQAGAARGPLVSRLEASGGRGRPRVLYSLAEAVTPAVQAVVELGDRARARAIAGIEASRVRLRRARALALRGVAPVGVLLARLRARDRAERSIARGGDVGRPEYGRDSGARALAAAAAWVLDGYRQAGATLEAAVVPDPPAWAVEAVPLW